MNTSPFTTAHFTSTGAPHRPRPDQDQPQADGGGLTHAAGERALVLGGGGSAGNAWVIGVVAGLFDAGLDVTTADLIIGTSAGSTAAARYVDLLKRCVCNLIYQDPAIRYPWDTSSDGGRSTS